IGTLGHLEFGHTFSGWWESLYIDDIKIDKYEPIEEVYEVVKINVKNQYGSKKLQPGDSVTAEIFTDGGVTDKTKTIETWSSSLDNGTTWTEMTSNVIPSGTNKLKINVTCTNTKGQTAEGNAEMAVEVRKTIDYVSLVNENFEGGNKEDEIVKQRNGWKIEGASNQVDVGQSFGGTQNSLRFSSLNNHVDNSLSLDFSKRGLDNSKENQLYLKYDFGFGLDDNTNVPVSDAIAYFDIRDVDGKTFSTIKLIGDTMYLIYFDEALGVNKSIKLYSGRSQVINVQRTLELHVDLLTNHYSVMIDGKMIGPDNGKWMQAGTNTVLGKGEPKDIQGIGYIVTGQENAVWWGSTYLDNVEVGRYVLPDSSGFKAQSVNIVNTFGASLDVANASHVTAEVRTVGGTVASTKNTWSYQTAGNSAWLPMTGTLVPLDAKKVKVDSCVTNAYGESDNISTERDVVANLAPSLDGLSISGDLIAGKQISASYTYLDEDTSIDRSTYEWYKTANITEAFKKIDGESGKAYTVTDKDLNQYIKLVVTPYDKFGA
ncbi:MAG: hypothetical protein RR145_04550, partial [Oscillospiraceae bacterium]